jgi:site-specific recombinase XerD
VLNSLNSADAKRGYRHAIDEFVDWYCSEPRLAFNRIVVLRYRSHLESRQLSPGTINLRLGAVRRLAYEASDCGLLSADLAAGIRRVKGAKKLGMRLGNWLTAEQGHALWQAPDRQRLKGKRDRALLALLLACGLRRHEAVALTLDHLQQREEHWAIVDLVGKSGHVRTVPVPDWVRTELDDWLAAAAIDRVTPTADRLVLFPIGVGEARYLSSYSIQHFASWSWMPDGKQIIFAGNDGHGWRMYIEDLVGGAPRPVTPPVVLIGPETYQCHMVSPDEKYVFARDLEGKAWLYPLAGDDPRPVPGIQRDDVWINWSMDGHSGYVFRWGGIPGRVFRLDLSTGNKQPILELSPDPTGLSAIPTIRITPDGKSYAYTSEHIFSELYLVDGVR